MRALLLLCLAALAVSAVAGTRDLRGIAPMEYPPPCVSEKICWQGQFGVDPKAKKNLDQTSTSCETYAFLKFTTTKGTCTGRAKADCTAVAEANNVFERAYGEWFLDDQGDYSIGQVCDMELVNATAHACAEAIARVWTSAMAKIDCTEQGFGCGWSGANGMAWAISFAEALAIAAANVGGAFTNATCFADIRAISSVLADAQDESRAKVCVENGSDMDYEMSYAAAVEVALASAFAKAVATACEDDVTKSASECYGESTAESVTAEQEGEAQTAQLDACEGSIKTDCCVESLQEGLCFCEDCDSPAIRVTKESGESRDAKRRSWRDNDTGDVCFCADLS